MPPLAANMERALAARANAPLTRDIPPESGSPAERQVHEGLFGRLTAAIHVLTHVVETAARATCAAGG